MAPQVLTDSQSPAILAAVLTMARVFTRRDRTARLLGVAHLLHQYPHGLSAQEIAHHVGMHVRTVYRDLRALESEVGLPLWQNGSRYGLDWKGLLPPLKLTLLEAVTLFLSARLMARYADKRDPRALGAFHKLAAVLPAPIAQHVLATIADLARLPSNDTYLRVFDLLATGWAEGRKVRIWYPYVHPDGRAFLNERLVSPYYLEPNPVGHGCYLIAFDAVTGAVRTFKLERIQQAELTAEHFDIPPDFDAPARLQHAWGVSDEEAVEVKLRFHEPAAASRARETRWHPSQQERAAEDGKLELCFTVNGLLEITPWILSWGAAVEVLEPPALRERVAAVARALQARYNPAPAERPEDVTA